jgi:deoxyribodipyrimidine photo-lyase
MTTRSLLWLRRDLRLADHPGLHRALDEADEVAVVFVVDPSLWGPSGTPRRWFLCGCLESLSNDLDGRLVVRHGDPLTVIPSLAAEIGADVVVITEDFGPYGRLRDAAVAEALEGAERRLVADGAPYAVTPGTILNAEGHPFQVFSAFHRRWVTHEAPPPLAVPDDLDAAVVSGLHHDGIPERPAIDIPLPEPGEHAAVTRLEEFAADGMARYASERDRPGHDGTSRLSPYLRWGCLHPRQAMAQVDRRSEGARVFESELCWREFYADVLWHRPDSARRAWRRDTATVEVDRGAGTDERFAAWAEGRTGFPIVDAGMRQLAATGWMHNRVRMIVASFLVKDLHLDWTRGARLFMELLVDGDLASNQHGWQWVAGTGTDASPYHRVFNPTRQGLRFDPEGDYVRRWVPELADVTGAAVHEPPAGSLLTNDYPEPIVDHADERDEALRRWKARVS